MQREAVIVYNQHSINTRLHKTFTYQRLLSAETCITIQRGLPVTMLCLCTNQLIVSTEINTNICLPQCEPVK